MRVSVSVSLSDRGGADWRDSAACREVDGDLFFPNDGENWKALTAKGVCIKCDVRHACLEWAMLHGELEGIWGGTSPRERMAMRRTRVPT